MLRFTDTERLGNKYTQIFLEKIKRKDFVSELRAGGDEKMSDQVEGENAEGTSL